MVTKLHYAEFRRIARSHPQVRRRKRRDSQTMARLAARIAPKDTGAGAASIHEEEQPDGTWRIAWDREHGYMLFQELGTEHIRAQPFLRPAAKRLEK